MTIASPTFNSKRIHSLDSIRGFALLGILIMNIQAFAMPEAAYLNPTAYGDFTGVNKVVWLVSHVFFDSKFMSLFSMLFGAGILLFCNNLVERGKKPFGIHYRRMFWLLLFGFIHAHLIWSGDVLFTYAMCGFILYSFYQRTIKTLWVVGISLLAIGWGLLEMTQFSLAYLSEEELTELNNDWSPTLEATHSKLAAMTGLWQEQFSLRTENAWLMQTVGFAYFGLWRVGGLMLIGMALFKQGLFTGALSTKDHISKILFYFLIGFGFTLYGLNFNIDNEWSLFHSQFRGYQFNYIGSVFVALGYAHSLALVIQKQWLTTAMIHLAYVGRMAFSNYIAQSLICTFIFYGFGLGLFGSIERWQQLVIVFAVWCVQIIGSKLWLTHFRFGPLEWVWRGLTYWRRPI
ncbi:DUF418 domain-containing protein [Reinekea forsetii]|nr:DUF418 domain-containing protein [Reinekea forsetii]